MAIALSVLQIVNSFGAGCAVRFLLGTLEAGMLPGIAFYMSRWDTKDELEFRLSLYIVFVHRSLEHLEVFSQAASAKSTASDDATHGANCSLSRD